MRALPPIPPQLELTQGAPRFWRSLEEWSQSPEFLPYLQREFPEQASEWPEGLSRRRFLELLGASLALAGLTSCSRQAPQKLVPYVQRPEEMIPGRPIYYSTTFPHHGYGKGVIVRTETGRPTKIEGNPDHPASLGAADSFMQASILGLYDPDRSQAVRQHGEAFGWEAFLQYAESRITEHLSDQGAGLFFMLGKSTSPSFWGQMQRLSQRFPRMSWCEYEPAEPIAAKTISGACVEAHYDLNRADVIVSLDADFLGEGPANLLLTKAFSNRRREPAKKFNRLYVAESAPTLTGAKADRRWSMKPSEIAALAAELLGAVTMGTPAALPEAQAIFAELNAHLGHSLVVAGDYQPEAVHAAVFQINLALGNAGRTVRYVEATTPLTPRISLLELGAAMQSGAVKTLVIAGSNPVYDLPGDLNFAAALGRVPHAIHLGLHEDETAAHCRWHLPETHYLESWGDICGAEGTPSLIQPLIEKLYPAAVSLAELVSVFADSPPQSGYDLVRNFWSTRFAPGTGDAWTLALGKGVLENLVPGTRPVPVEVTAVAPVAAAPTVGTGDFEIVFRLDSSADDGRFANNAWLQELPRPLTKITWDNVVMLSPKSAALAGVASGDGVELIVNGKTVNAPVWVQPGHADGCVSVTLGYGRMRVGNIGNGVGFNVNPLRASAQPWAQAGVRFVPNGQPYALATTQQHFSMEGRGLVQIETLDQFHADPARAHEEMPDPDPHDDLYPPYEYKGHAWGMAIDLNTCIGCNACVVACQAENNISVVGKDQVQRGREMHWIRIDRYFEGEPEAPDIHFEPVTCMQCEQAPCEVVCPVAATVHSSEGLNDMVYNRCVGTRYCSNNCPYKVRRFNFLKYDDDTHPTLALQRNPDVTVRTRGVMEKCTYCVQRIESARIDAEVAARPMRDGDIVTACQATCPADAIVFGDLNDPRSRVSRLKAQPRNYSLLPDLNTHPRTTYLAKIINPPAS